jgi:hypothetical protein
MVLALSYAAGATVIMVPALSYAAGAGQDNQQFVGTIPRTPDSRTLYPSFVKKPGGERSVLSRSLALDR